MLFKGDMHCARVALNVNDGLYFSLMRFARLSSIDAIDNLKDFLN